MIHELAQREVKRVQLPTSIQQSVKSILLFVTSVIFVHKFYCLLKQRNNYSARTVNRSVFTHPFWGAPLVMITGSLSGSVNF
jgi:hypothetical protein